MRRDLLLLITLGACGGGTSSVPGDSPGDAGTGDEASPSQDGARDEASAPPDGAAPDSKAGEDVDGDGIPDATEDAYADAYLPFLSIHPKDNCPTHGVLYRLSPHPKEAKRLMMWVDVLYDQDCGSAGHAGDDETFGVVIDPARPAPDGILAIRAISHQNTPCEHVTTCGTCGGMKACSTGARNGKAYPVVYPSKDKHGNYADLATCSGSILCDSGGCSLSTPDAPARVNAGEPAHPMVHDLTTQGFITTASGWTKTELFHFDPWKAGNFGGAGDVSKDLVDTSFVVDTTACP